MTGEGQQRSQPEELTAQQLTLIQFALSEGNRSIEHQQDELVRLRERATSQLAYATTISTFVLGVILTTGPVRDRVFYGLTIGATVLATVVLVAAYRVGRAVPNWLAKIDTGLILTYAKQPDFESLGTLVGFWSQARDANEKQLEGKRRAFAISLWLDGALVVWLLVSLWVLV